MLWSAVVIMNARRFSPAAFSSLFLLASGFSVSLGADQAALPELRTAAQVRSLSVEEAELGYPVHLKGVLTFFDEKRPSKSFRFVQDSTAGVYFYFETGVTNPGLSVGQEIELEGHTGKGEFAPIVWVHQIRVTGEGTFPKAKPVSFDQLASGQEDSQFVEVHGVVRSVRLEEQRLYYLIDVATGDSHLTAYISELPVARSEDLIDCKVRIRGVCFT